MGALQFNLLKLVGFKSFVEPTEFQIEPGLTGIVGPNGGGKSNLLEALRWVMGASSAKAMRAKGMDDVIFNGTKKRPERGQACVTLTVDNSAKVAPSLFGDDEIIEVTRSITRGAGSKYQVNGKTVRAKDIHLLFADASTGANSPALVRQGQINELIAAKPENRRRILEEAAGISGLHTRRHEAELRLRSAATNLERLEDVLGQIESRLLSLRRQSRQATRYKKLAGEIREYRTLLWLKRWEHALVMVKGNKKSLSECEHTVRDLTRQVANLSTEVANITTKLEPHRQEQITTAAVFGRLNASKEALEKDEQSAKSEISELEARLQFLKGDIEREEGIVADAQQAIEKLESEQRDLGAVADNIDLIEGAEQAAKKAIDRGAELEDRLSELNRKDAQLQARHEGAERESTQLTERMGVLKAELETIDAAITELNRENSNPASDNLFASALGDAQKALANAKRVESDALSRTAEAAVSERETREALSVSRQKLAEAQAEQNALKSVLKSVRDEADWVPVLENISVKKGYEHALAVAFGEELDAAIGDDAPIGWAGAKTAETKLPAGVKSLGDFVQAPKELAPCLAQIGIIDAKDGNTLAAQLHLGQRLVSKDGDLWRWDGYFITSGVANAAAVRLENINRLAEIATGLGNLYSTVKKRESNWSLARQARDLAEEKAKEARAVLPALEAAEHEARAAANRFEAEQARQSGQLSALQGRKTRIQPELADLARRELAAQALLRETENADLYCDEIEVLDSQVRETRKTAGEASAEVRRLKAEIENRDRRLNALKQDMTDWDRRAAQANERIDGLQNHEAETRISLLVANDSPDEFERRKQKILSELSDAEARQIKASDALAAIENALRNKDGELRASERELGIAREERAATEARYIGAKERIDELRAQIAETLSCEPEDLKGRFDTLSPDSGLSEIDIEKKLERLSRERENMGGVNLRANEEAVEQEERLATLNTEKQDLIGAITRLRDGINNLNAEGRERLLKAFDVVNGHFGRLFTTLFGGGSAALALTESEDPLEAGLEVLASPPGKKLGSMSLLSGGEQALTATALIFAVFLSNPAPICVLDEVDAPLDDANVERYCDLLDEMCKQTETRFMVITHNAVTMSRVDRLFGVTMAEKGISQLVSMDLGQAEKLSVA